MPDFAKHIELTREGRDHTLRVDGEEFPWYIGDAITVEPHVDEMPAVKITLYTDRLDVRDHLSPPSTTETDSTRIAKWFASPLPRFSCGSDRTSPLARAEAARDQAEELLRNAHKAIEENHATIEELRSQLAERAAGDAGDRNRLGVGYVEVRPDFTQFTDDLARSIEETAHKIRAAL